MKYEEAKNLAPKDFKRLSGVYPETYSQMVKVVKEAEQQKKVSGRPSKLSAEDQVLMTLEYWREYRTYFHIGKTWGVYESTAFRIVRKVEDILIKVEKIQLPGQKNLLEEQSLSTVVIDVTESPIERPKKTKKVLFREKKGSYPQVSSSG